MKYASSFAVLLFAAGASATEHNRPANITVTCNQHGAVIVLGRNTISPGATYYLGESCDASRPGVGEGRWWYAASAFIVEINGEAVRFANDLDCAALPYCRPQ